VAIAVAPKIDDLAAFDEHAIAGAPCLHDLPQKRVVADLAALNNLDRAAHLFVAKRRRDFRRVLEWDFRLVKVRCVPLANLLPAYQVSAI